jgi:Response regulator containing a CheY-like receiver domain and an HTH DNA-binding domain
MDENFTFLLVDDHALFRAGLVVLLQKMSGDAVVHEVGTAAAALQTAAENPAIDLVLLDYTLPDSNGIQVLRALKAARPELPVILLSAHIDSGLIQQALKEQASGFIPKTSTPDVMLSAVQLVLNGGIYIPLEAMNAPAVANSLSAYQTAAAGGRIQLTQRQMDVLQQMKNGLSNKEIARQLHMSPSTVKVHVAAILRELAASSRTQAVFLAKDRGLLD